MPLTEAEHAKRRAMYDAGMSDKQIATKLGLSHVTIALWRYKQGLKTKHAIPKKLSAEQKAQRIELFKRGLGDAEIARIVGVHRRTISFYREYYGFPIVHNRQHIEPGKKFCAKRRAERIRLIEAGWTDEQIALHQGTTYQTVTRFRRRHGFAMATGTLNQLPSVVHLGSVAYRIADPSMSSWLEEMGATVW